MKTQPLLSVIIPLYNCAPYIKRCLTSLLNQNVDSEIIIIDDGSTDGGDSIIKVFQISHPEIILIRQENQGPSAARNKGIARSSGKYIYFMDADDFLKSNTLNSIIKFMEHHSADVARFQTQIIAEDKADFEAQKSYNCLPLHISNIYTGVTYIQSTRAMAGVTLWRHIILKDLIQNSGVKFDEKLFLEEDYVYLFRLLINANKVIVCDGDKPHYWVKRMSSSSNSVNSRALHSYLDLFRAYRNLLDIYTDKVSRDCRDYIYVRIALAMNIYIFNLVRLRQETAFKEALSLLKDLKFYPFGTSRALSAKFNPLKGYKIKWIILNIKPLLMLMQKFYK